MVDSIFWECLSPCNLENDPHHIMHTDYDGIPFYFGAVPSHVDAIEVANKIREYLDDFADEEIFYIVPDNRRNGKEEILAMIQLDIDTMREEVAREKADILS